MFTEDPQAVSNTESVSSDNALTLSTINSLTHDLETIERVSVKLFVMNIEKNTPSINGMLQACVERIVQIRTLIAQLKATL
jgi:hypothetical protein